jgi:hypothetical protein
VAASVNELPFDAAAKSAASDLIPVVERRVEFQLSVGPKPFAGVWYKRSPADCHNRTDNPNYVPLRFTSTSLKFYEAKCSIRSANQKGNTYTLSTDCVSEGEASSSTTTIKMLDADTFTIDAYEPAGIRGWTYRRCGSNAPRVIDTGSSSRGDKSRLVAKVNKNGCLGTFIRNTCRPGRSVGCAVPEKAGEKSDFVSQSYIDGYLTYSGYRTADYAASDVRLEAGCRLPNG